MQSEKGTILIGVLRCDRPVSEAWSERLACLQVPDGYTVTQQQIFSPGQSKFEEIEAARNELAAEAAAYQYLLFLDDDVIPPADTLVKLTAAFTDDVRVVAGLCPRRYLLGQPGNYLVWRGSYENNTDEYITDRSPGSVFRCSGIGTGCMMIDTRVFHKMNKPYFVSTFAVRPNNRVPDGFLTTRVGEDATFCNRVQKLGYGILAHGGVLCEHESPARQERYDQYLTSQL